MMDNVNFTDAQLERIDSVQNAAYEFCKVLTENDNLEWNMEYIGKIADVASDILVECGFKVRYPAHVMTVDGNEYITDWHERS